MSENKPPILPQTLALPVPTARLGLLARIFSGGTPSKDRTDFWEGGTLPWIGSGEVNQRLVTRPTALITEEAVRESSTRFMPAGSLIMALAGQGKTKGMVAQMEIGAYGNQSLACISRFRGDSRFLFWWLTACYREIRGLASDETRDGLNQEIVGALPVPLFPQERQRAIADFLDRETERIDVLIAKKERLVELLNNKIGSLTDEYVKGCATTAQGFLAGDEPFLTELPQGWQMKRLKEICAHIGNGFVGPTRDILIDSDEPDAVPYLQSTHVKNGRIDFERRPYYVSRRWLTDKPKAQVQNGDLLIVQTGDCGATALVDEKFDGAGCHALIITRPKRRLVSPEWLLLVLNSPYGRSKLEKIQTGALHPHLEVGFVREMSIPVPPRETQDALVVDANAHAERIGTFSQQTIRSVDRLRELRSALITAAVTGQIDPADWRKRGTTEWALDAAEAADEPAGVGS